MKTEEPAQGRYITDTDNEHRSLVALIGTDIAEKLFPGRDPIGKELDVDGRPYEVVGSENPSARCWARRRTITSTSPSRRG